MWLTIKKLLAQLLFWIYDFIDMIHEVFRALAGLDNVDGDKNLLDIFVDHTVGGKVIFSLAVVGAIIAVTCGVAKIILEIIRYKVGGEHQSHSRTIGLTFGAVVGSIICVIFVLLFIAVSNMLLRSVDAVLAPAEGQKFSQNLFDLSVEETYQIDYSNPLTRPVPKTDENGNYVQKVDGSGNPVTDAEGNPVWEEVEETYFDYYYVKDANGNPVLENGKKVYISQSGYKEGVSAKDIDVSSMSVNKVFGKHKTIMGWEFESLSYSEQPMVDLESFNFLTAYLVAVIMLISLIWICFGLVKRLYDIIVLIFMMPLICGTIPLDEGARFKAWRETFISKVLLVFGAVIAINVFFQIAPIISTLDLSAVNASKIVQRIIQMFLYMGGALCISASQALIARVLGTSADESRELAQSARTILTGATLGIGGMVGAKNIVFGGYNKYGRHRRGIIPTIFHGRSGGGANGGNVGGMGGNTGAGTPGTLAKPGNVNSVSHYAGKGLGGGRDMNMINRVLGAVPQTGTVGTGNKAAQPVNTGALPSTKKPTAFRDNTKRN